MYEPGTKTHRKMDIIKDCGPEILVNEKEEWVYFYSKFCCLSKISPLSVPNLVRKSKFQEQVLE